MYLLNIKYLIVLAFCCNNFVLGTYSGFTLYRATPIEDKQIDFLKNISYVYDVVFWRPPANVFQPVDFVIGPLNRQNFVAEANKIQLYMTVVIADVQSAFDKQKVDSYNKNQIDSFDWKRYYRLDDIYNWIRDLAVAYPGVMEVISIGTTYEERDILLVKIILSGSKKRSKVFFEGGIHAREWIAPAFVTYMIYQILTAPNSTDKELKAIAETYEWYFVPVLNPDGYKITHNEDRLWRKNRNKAGGVDLNRNFGFAFGTAGSSKDKDSDFYCGPQAFSEKETRALVNYVRLHSTKIEYYLSFHSYGQYIIIPFANEHAHRGNYYEVLAMCQEATAKIARRYKTQYTCGNSFETLGFLASGDSIGWIKGKYEVPYVVAIELRDNGDYGLALPSSLILPTCRETMDGIISFLKPRTANFTKLRQAASNQAFRSLYNIVLVLNVLVFNIALFY